MKPGFGNIQPIFLAGNYWEQRFPSGLVATVYSSTQINLIWVNNGHSDYTGHKIYTSTDNINFTLKDTISTIGTTHSVTGLTSGTLYYIKIVAYKETTQSIYSNVSDAFTIVNNEYQDVYDSYITKPDSNQTQAGDNFVGELKNGGLLSTGKIDAYWMWASHTNTNSEAMTNWKNPTGTKAEIKGTVTFQNNHGVMGNGIDGYIDLHWNPTVDGLGYTRDSASAGAYCYSLDANYSWELGCADAVSFSGMISFVNLALVYNRIYFNSLTYINAPVSACYSGLKCINRSSSSSVQMFCNNVSYTATKTSTGIPNVNIYALALNNNGTPTNFSVIQQAFCYVGGSLTVTEMQVLKTALDNYISSCQSAILEPTVVSSNDYINYQYFPNDNIVFQRGDILLVHKNNNFYLSKDCGITWSNSMAFTPDNDIEFAYVFDNYNILFAVKDHLYASYNQLSSYSEVIVTDINGNDFTPFATGNNFKNMDIAPQVKIDGTEYLVWGNYTNVYDGNSEINVFYSIDNGLHVKVAYKFGRNSYYSSLGDAGNPIICRHIHTVSFNPNDNSFWIQTGDQDRSGPVYECHWIRGIYNVINDTWEWSIAYSGSENLYYKSTGMYFGSTTVYWVSDSTNIANAGIFSCPISGLADTGNYIHVFASTKRPVTFMCSSNGEIVCGTYNVSIANSLMTSKDFGVTTNEQTLTNLGLPINMAFFTTSEKDSNGWYSLRLVSVSDHIMNKGTLRIKLK